MGDEGGRRVPEAGKSRIKVGMIGLGCAKNLVDGEIMLGHLVREGAELVRSLDEADVVIVNTCGFITSAKEESVEAILEAARLKETGSLRRLVVAGCMSQRYGEELAREIPEIDAFVGLDELEEVVRAVRGELDGHVPVQRGALRVYDHGQPRLVSTGFHAFLKVAEGCNNPCAFCHIPRMRGAFRSRPLQDLVEEAVGLERAGVRELVLIAQDTTRYGEDLGLDHGLRRLLEALLEATDVPWIRFLYAYPATLDEGLFSLMAREPRIVPYLDIPLQHASRTVLKAMRRGGDAGTYEAMIQRARETVSRLVLRTTMIVGFPGEGEAEFEELLDFVRRVRFDHLGVFTYSWQEENPGAELGDPVPEEEKERRRARVLELQQEISHGINQGLVGRRLPALVEGELEEMPLLLRGRLQRHAPEIDGRLLINDGTAAAGSLVEVEITEAHPYDLVGRIVRILEPAPSRPAALPVLV